MRPLARPKLRGRGAEQYGLIADFNVRVTCTPSPQRADRLDRFIGKNRLLANFLRAAYAHRLGAAEYTGHARWRQQTQLRCSTVIARPMTLRSPRECQTPTRYIAQSRLTPPLRYKPP